MITAGVENVQLNAFPSSLPLDATSSFQSNIQSKSSLSDLPSRPKTSQQIHASTPAASAPKQSRSLLHTERLSPDEGDRLSKYLKAIRIQFGDKNNRTTGSTSDFIQLALRATGHQSRARRDIIEAVDNSPNVYPYLKNLFPSSQVHTFYHEQIKAELELLKDESLFFGEYTPDVFDYLHEQSKESVVDDLKKICPTLFNLLFSLCQRRVGSTPDDKNYARIISIVSTICFSRHPMKSNCFPALMSILFHSSGAKRRVFDITQPIGLTESYDTVLSTTRGLRTKAVEFILTWFRRSIAALGYDNCDMRLGVSEQSNDKKAQMFSITTAVMYAYSGIPVPGGVTRPLKQTDLNHSFVLHLSEFQPTDAQERALKAFAVANVIRALSEAYPDYVKTRLEKSDKLRSMSAMPQVERLDPPPASCRRPVPLMPVMKDESTVANNIEIIRNLLREQLEIPDDVFEMDEPVFLLGGDNKTCNRIWSAIQASSGNMLAYDRLRHIIAIPGLFHAQMHIVSAIISLYWGDEPKSGDKLSHATLRYAAGKMARKFVGPSNQVYTHARTFLRDNYQARIVAEFHSHIFKHRDLKRHGIDRHSHPEQVAAVVQKITSKQFIFLVERTIDSLDIDTFDDGDHNLDDTQRKVNLTLVQDCHIWEMFSYGIRYGDIGLIKAAIPDLTYLFARARKQLYTAEFLYLKRLIDSDFASVEARRALASALLVNPTGREDGWFPLDLSVEFLNRDVKEQWGAKGRSAMSVRELSEYCTLNAIFFEPMRRTVSHILGHNRRPKHTHVNRRAVIQLLAKNLIKSMVLDSSRRSEKIPGVFPPKGPNPYGLVKRKLELLSMKFYYSAANESDSDEDADNVIIAALNPVTDDCSLTYAEENDKELVDAVMELPDDNEAFFDECGDQDVSA